MICCCIILSARNTLYSFLSVHTTRVTTDRSPSNVCRIAGNDVYVIKTTDIYIFSTDYKFVVALCITKTLLYVVYYSGFSLPTVFFSFQTNECTYTFPRTYLHGARPLPNVWTYIYSTRLENRWRRQRNQFFLMRSCYFLSVTTYKKKPVAPR